MPTLITDALKTIVDEELEQIPFEDYPMLDRLRRNFKTTSQKEIPWNANVGGSSITGELVTVDVTTDNNTDTVVPAKLPIATHRFRHRFSLLKTDVAQAKAIGKGVLRDLYAMDINNGLREMMIQLGKSIYTGDGTAAHAGMIGLNQVTTAATYANIATATYPGWASVVQANGGTNRALSTDLLEDTDIAIRRAGGMWTAIYAPPEICKRYKKLFTDSTAFSASVNVEVGGKVDLGFTQLSFKGKPIIEDPNAPNNALQFVDEPRVMLYTFKQDNTESKMGLQFAVEMLPNMNPDADTYVIVVKPQLQARSRKAVSVLKDITQ